jgi:tetratricopeptide (TPR) repeat protein
VSANLNVINQTLRNFTVQIRALDETIVGTGIAMSLDGKVVTCAHVARDALGIEPRQAQDQELIVYFPKLNARKGEAHRARVLGCFAQHDDDVVLLQLTSQQSPLTPDQIAVIGAGDESAGNTFQSYGYRRLDKYNAAFAQGQIMGSIEAPANEDWQAEPLQLKSADINHGMSGAAVLDVEKNLVVGIVSQKWFADNSGVDRDTAFAVNAAVLSLAPLNLEPYRGAAYPRQAALQPRIEAEQLQAARPSKEKLVGLPSRLETWVGRAAQIEALQKLYADDQTRMVGMIGFGGEGKTSLAREVVERILNADKPPHGVFWWSFYERRSSDEFFEAALTYVGGEKMAQANPSATAKAGMVAALLAQQRYIFVLDGLEVMQHEDDDEYGLLTSDALREFLRFFAAPAHASFCLVTSRAPLLDVQAFTTYQEQKVAGLSAADGVTLLRETGVQGTDAQLKPIVAQWDGHALTLTLLGKYLAEKFGGDLAHLGDVPPPTSGEPFYERVARVLRRYDDYMNAAEKAFLMIFSAFRLPVRVSAFPSVFRTESEKTALNAPLVALTNAAFDALVQGLVQRGLIRLTPLGNEAVYTIHPLIRAYYTECRKKPDDTPTHRTIADYYEATAAYKPLSWKEVMQGKIDFPSLDDLAPYIEIVHHLCAAGAYDEAWKAYWERIKQRERYVITQMLGAYETDLALVMAFFPNNDLTRDPAVTNAGNQGYLINNIGLCLMQLGRLREADPFFKRDSVICIKQKDWRNASVDWQNLADVRLRQGDIMGSLAATEEALKLAKQVTDERYRLINECGSLTLQAWLQHLQGQMKTANADFAKAEKLEPKIYSGAPYLYTIRGIFHADHLCRVGNIGYARRVTEANLIICTKHGWKNFLSQCQRVLGDLAADAGEQAQARQHYDDALRLARSGQRHDVLIESLMGRGRWYARCANDAGAAFNDLNEAMIYILQSGYRRHEADARVALAWAHLLAGDTIMAQQEAQAAHQMSAQMGYHWGQVDADEVIGKLK